MAAISIQILVAGKPCGRTAAMLYRLALRGWGAQHVDTAAEAKEVMQTFRFAVVLAAEQLPDGRGYDLARVAQRQLGNLFVGIPLSETLWLPVIERGAFVLGERALNQNVFENEVEMALGRVGAEPDADDQRSAEAAAGASHRLAPVKHRAFEAA